MISETVLGVLFCFFLPLAIAARFWHWYRFFKRGQKSNLLGKCSRKKPKSSELFPLDCTWWLVRNIVDNSIDCTFDRVGDSSADLLQDVMRNLRVSC